MPLPTEKIGAQPRIGRVFAYAVPKIGKSTLFATLDPERTILLDCEDGLAAIEGYKHPVTSWGRTVGVQGEGRAARAVYDDHSLLGVGRLLHTAKQEAAERGEEPMFRVGVIDTADALSQMCADYVLAQLGAGDNRQGQFVHASDFDYGKGWSAISEEWKTRVSALARVLDSVILIGHAKRRTATSRTGAEFDVYTPELGPAGLREWTLGFVDHILFMHMIQTEEGVPVRAIRTQQSVAWEAGGRTAVNGPRLPDPILLPDAATSGQVLRAELERVSAPPAQAATRADTGDIDHAAAVEPAKPKAKAAAKRKPAAKTNVEVLQEVLSA